MTPRTAGLRRSLEKLRQQHEQQVEKLAALVRTDLVIPFCRKHGLEFLAGNADWFFFDKLAGRVEDWDLEQMPGTRRLLAALRTPSGIDERQLGEFAQNYVPTT